MICHEQRVNRINQNNIFDRLHWYVFYIRLQLYLCAWNQQLHKADSPLNPNDGLQMSWVRRTMSVRRPIYKSKQRIVRLKNCLKVRYMGACITPAWKSSSWEYHLNILQGFMKRLNLKNEITRDWKSKPIRINCISSNEFHEYDFFQRGSPRRTQIS